MKELKDLIALNIKRFKEFEYYIPLVEKAMKNRVPHPDISIETCKALLEGMSKTIIEDLNPKLPLETKGYDRKNLDFYMRNSFQLLKENDDAFEDDFIIRVVSLSNSLGYLRNARGDISHGRSVPKVNNSSAVFANSICKITEGLLLYMLESYFRKNELFEDKREKELEKEAETVVEYDGNIDFNEYLDDLYPLEGKTSYSRALYDQYYEDYIIQLDEYNGQLSEE